MGFPCSFTPTGLASSLALISAELYLMIRFIFFVSPRGLGWFSKLDTLGDSRVYRASGLLLLDVLTITPATKPINLLVDFVPFAIGAVAVLCKPILPRLFTSTKHAVASRFRLSIGKNRERSCRLDVVRL